MKRSVIASIFVFVAIVSMYAQNKPDALELYRKGRDLDANGRTADAQAAYNQAIDVCKQDLTASAGNMDAYSIYTWSLVRLGKYQDAVNTCLEALKITPDFRITETLAESYFFLGSYKDSLRSMEKYIDGAPMGERISTAYFFEGEIYRMSKQLNHAEMAYTTAVYLEPSISLWWFRLGSVRESIGDKLGSSVAFEKALKLRPDYKEAADGLSRVRT